MSCPMCGGVMAHVAGCPAKPNLDTACVSHQLLSPCMFCGGSSGVHAQQCPHYVNVSPPAISPEDRMRAVMKMDQKQHAGALERQVGGDHYRTTSIQPWEVIDAWKLNFYEGNALKYLQRWRRKGGVADLRKLIHYIERLIELEEKNAPPQENQER